MSRDEMAFDRVALAVSKAALDPTGWLSVVQELGRTFPGLRSQIIGWDITQRNSMPQYHDNYPAEFVDSYIAHFQYRNPWIAGWARAPVGTVITDREVLDEALLVQTEFYNDWIRPQEDMRVGVGVVLFADASRNFLLGGNIPRKLQESYQVAFQQFLMRATPLMQQALEINRTLLGLRLDAFVLRTGIEPANAAILIVGEGRSLVHANERAEHLLASGKLLRLSARGRIDFTDAAAQAELERAMRATGHGPSTFLAASPAGPVVRTVPLAGKVIEELNVGAIALAQRPVLALVIQFTTSTEARLPAVLQRTTGLSVSETLVALSLADGLTLSEIAGARRVSIHTVRNQIKSALEKTASRRQSDLVRLVERLRQGGAPR